MDRGMEFLKSQVSNAVAQHRVFVQALEDHEGQAEDVRFRELCGRFIPKAREHQRMLEDYGSTLGTNESLLKKATGMAFGVVRDLADVVRESDFLRLVGDIVLARQAEDTFKTFREAGRALSIQPLAQIGEVGERDHDEYVKEANKLVQQMFIEHVRGAEDTIKAQQPTSTA
jgi:hypothetical protein